jgi:hypothetical protein
MEGTHKKLCYSYGVLPVVHVKGNYPVEYGRRVLACSPSIEAFRYKLNSPKGPGQDSNEYGVFSRCCVVILMYGLSCIPDR